jgi:tripartite-type tricarboxylate transporter receptor subunit TctC
MKRRLLLAGAAAAAALPGSSFAQGAWPARPVRWIVPFLAGGPTDAVARIVAAELGKALGTQVVVENRSGANGNIAAEFVARAPADGYTLLMGNGATHGSNPALYPKLSYDAARDFVAVATLTESMLILVVNNDLPVQNVRELIAHAKANPGRLSYASVGKGSAHHLAMELFKIRTGTDMAHVPYRGSAAALPDLMAGRVQLMFDASAAQLIRAGRVRALAAASTRRWPLQADIPSMAEAGVPDFHVAGWFGMFAPAGTPATIVERLGAECGRVMVLPEVRARVEQLGLNVFYNGPQETARWVVSEMAKWPAVVKASGARPDD